MTLFGDVRDHWHKLLKEFETHDKKTAPEDHGGPLPDNYESLSAAEKRPLLQARLRTPYQALPTIPGGDLTQMIEPAYLQKTFTTNSDELPAHGDDPHRSKLIHCFGVGGTLRFTPAANTKMTGMLAKPVDLIARLSNGQNPSSPSKAFIPGVALKFLVDGTTSRNLLFGGNTDGQTDDNFFQSPLHTWIACPTDWQLTVLNQAFTNAVDDATFNKGVPQGPRELPVRHVCEVDETGKAITEVHAPLALQLRPKDGLAAWWSKDRADDFRTTFGKLKDGEVLFDVLSERPVAPAADQVGKGPDPAVVIGTLALTGELVASSFCDRLLFFEHPLRTVNVGVFPACPHAS